MKRSSPNFNNNGNNNHNNNNGNNNNNQNNNNNAPSSGRPTTMMKHSSGRPQSAKLPSHQQPQPQQQQQPYHMNTMNSNNSSKYMYHNNSHMTSNNSSINADSDSDEDDDRLAQVAQSFLDDDADSSNGSGFSISFNVYANGRGTTGGGPNSKNNKSNSKSNQKKNQGKETSYEDLNYSMLNGSHHGGGNDDNGDNGDDDDDDDDATSIDSNIDDILKYSIDDGPSGTVNMNEINMELQNLQRRIESSSLKTTASPLVIGSHQNTVYSQNGTNHQAIHHHHQSNTNVNQNNSQQNTTSHNTTTNNANMNHTTAMMTNTMNNSNMNTTANHHPFTPIMAPPKTPTVGSGQVSSVGETPTSTNHNNMNTVGGGHSNMMPTMTTTAMNRPTVPMGSVATNNNRGNHMPNNAQQQQQQQQYIEEKKELESRIRELERKMTELEDKLQASQTNEQHSKQAYDNEAELTSQLRDINSRLSSTVNAQGRQIDVLQQELQMQNDSNNHKQALLNQLEQQMMSNEKNHSQQVQELKKKLHRAIQEIKKQRAYIEKVKANEAQKQTQIETQKDNIIAELKSTIETLKTSHIELENRVNSMFQENTRLRKSSSELQEERNRLEQDRNQKQEQLTNLQQEFTVFEAEFRKVKAKYDEFSRHYSELVRERRADSVSKATTSATATQRSAVERRRPQSASAATQKRASHLNVSASPGYVIQERPPSTTTPQMQLGSAPPKVRSRTPKDSPTLITTTTATTMATGVNSEITPEEDTKDYLDIPFYKDTRYLKQKLLTERKRVELKNIEIAGLKELLYKSQLQVKTKGRKKGEGGALEGVTTTTTTK